MNIKEYPLCHLTPALRITALCSVFQEMREVGYSSKGEMHDFWEVVFILSGEAEAIADNRVYLLKEGQAILHPPLEFHRLKTAGNAPMEIIVLTFTASHFPTEHRRICTFGTAAPFSRCVAALRQSFETAGFRLIVQRPNEAAHVQRAVNELEIHLLELLETAGDAINAMSDTQAALYGTAVSVMHQHLGARLSATEIAAACGKGVSTLQKLFLKYTGMGMMRYYHDLQMHHARYLLDGGKSVKETALALGFTDQNYFSTAYRRHFGIPPSATTRVL